MRCADAKGVDRERTREAIAAACGLQRGDEAVEVAFGRQAIEMDEESHAALTRHAGERAPKRGEPTRRAGFAPTGERGRVRAFEPEAIVACGEQSLECRRFTPRLEGGLGGIFVESARAKALECRLQDERALWAAAGKAVEVVTCGVRSEAPLGDGGAGVEELFRACRQRCGIGRDEWSELAVGGSPGVEGQAQGDRKAEERGATNGAADGVKRGGAEAHGRFPLETRGDGRVVAGRMRGKSRSRCLRREGDHAIGLWGEGSRAGR